ncbi:MAG: Fic family protein [Eubacteriales bacterium]
MSEGYKPPFTMTDEITNLVIEIAELTGRIGVTEELSKNPTLRRENRIHSIHSSLAIERNSLTIDQVSDVIDGKRVLGPPKDIREVQNAYEAYEMLSGLNPYVISDLLTAHQIMMLDLVKEAGVFRSKGVGVYAGETLIHAGTPPQYVPDLITELFQWLKESELHPLIKSCIFHYEFEFIHPFADGNGRTGRMWHTLILAKWKEFYLWLPIESLIHERQEEYYEAINLANNQGESTVFVKFMLEIIKQVLCELAININEVQNANDGLPQDRLLAVIKENGRLSAKKLAERLNLSERQVQRLLKNMKDEGMIERQGTSRTGKWIIL